MTANPNSITRSRLQLFAAGRTRILRQASQFTPNANLNRFRKLEEFSLRRWLEKNLVNHVADLRTSRTSRRVRPSGSLERSSNNRLSRSSSSSSPNAFKIAFRSFNGSDLIWSMISAVFMPVTLAWAAQEARGRPDSGREPSRSAKGNQVFDRMYRIHRMLLK